MNITTKYVPHNDKAEEVLKKVMAKVSTSLKFTKSGLWGCLDAYWISFYLFAEEIGTVYAEKNAKALRLFDEICKSGFWWWPTNLGCIIVERPRTLKFGDGDIGQKRLHNDGGPVVEFADGGAMWALNGVYVSQYVAETPADELDPKIIGTETNAQVRSEIVKKIGVDRCVTTLSKGALDTDGNYELHDMNLGEDQLRRYLVMQNPSVDTVHVESVHPDCATVQDALNFRNGLTPEMIDDENGAEWIQQGDVIIRPKGEKKFKSRPKVIT